jgi:hypothetical protein
VPSLRSFPLSGCFADKYSSTGEKLPGRLYVDELNDNSTELFGDASWLGFINGSPTSAVESA